MGGNHCILTWAVSLGRIKSWESNVNFKIFYLFRRRNHISRYYGKNIIRLLHLNRTVDE